MGGRGASSKEGIKVVSYESLINKQKDIKFHLYFEKTIEVFEKGYLNKTVRYNKFDWNKVDEAIIDTYVGQYKRNTKLLKDKGFKIVSQTKFREDDKKSKNIKMYVKRG